MKFFLLTLLLPLLAHASNGSGNVAEIIQLSVPGSSTTGGGGAVVPTGDVTSGTVYQIYAIGGTSSDYYPFYKNGVLFSVATGHKAYCFAGTVGSGSVGYGYQLMSATATFSNGATSVTGGVWQSGSAGSSIQITGPTATSNVPMPGPYTFDGTAATVWPGFQVTGASNPTIWVSMSCITI